MFLHFIEDREHKEAFLELAHRVATSDGFVNRNEWNYIRSWKLELGMEDWEPDAGKRERTLAEMIGCVKEEQVKNIFFAEVLLLIFADGTFNDEEQRIAGEMKKLFGYSDDIFEAFMGWVARMGQLKVEGMQLILDPSSARR
ncbi:MULTISPECIES: hypothetical protein [Cohnella]|uniref:hypothetical protein n=1 Tax=Cohnella TaxID=329857 RepID=UPI0009BC607B|nr:MULTISPECIES: hypothetical protein [Cohnella]MBN2981341.1 TerB family tellurite resistance protein [Cohnella algarum]